MSTTQSHESDAFALRSERVLFGGKLEPALVVVRGERIEAVMHAQTDVASNLAVHDVGNYVLMPGLVDSHVHVNEPGRTEWEGFETATRAAASGGITTIVDMPLNCSPVTTTTRALDLDLAGPRPRARANTDDVQPEIYWPDVWRRLRQPIELLMLGGAIVAGDLIYTRVAGSPLLVAGVRAASVSGAIAAAAVVLAVIRLVSGR